MSTQIIFMKILWSSSNYSKSHKTVCFFSHYYVPFQYDIQNSTSPLNLGFIINHLYFWWSNIKIKMALSSWSTHREEHLGGGYACIFLINFLWGEDTQTSVMSRTHNFLSPFVWWHRVGCVNILSNFVQLGPNSSLQPKSWPKVEH